MAAVFPSRFLLCLARLLRPAAALVLFAFFVAPALVLCQAHPADAQGKAQDAEQRTPATGAGPAEDKAPDQLRTLSREELDVIKVMNAQERAWNQGDMQGFAAAYKNSPDTLFIGQQVSHGYAQMLSDYIHNYPTREAMGSLSFTDIEPHVLDSRFVVVLGRYHLDRSKKAGGPATGLFSLVFEKTDKGWKIVVDHTT